MRKFDLLIGTGPNVWDLRENGYEINKEKRDRFLLSGRLILAQLLWNKRKIYFSLFIESMVSREKKKQTDDGSLPTSSSY